MSKRIQELREILLQGQKLSMQGSLDRRMPDKKSVPYLLRRGLKEYIKENTEDAIALRMLSQAEECLLNYNAAIDYLTKAIELSGKDKKDMARLVLLKDYQTQWNDLGLSPDQLKKLGDFLSEKLEECTCDHSLIFTKILLNENVMKSKSAKLIKAIQNAGGFCDCEVLANVVRS